MLEYFITDYIRIFTIVLYALTFISRYIYTFIRHEDRIQHSTEIKTDRQTDRQTNTTT